MSNWHRGGGPELQLTPQTNDAGGGLCESFVREGSDS